MYKITLTKFNGPKKFTIASKTDIITREGYLKPVEGYRIELKNYQAFITEKEDADVKARFGIGIIEKLKSTHIYKGKYLEIVEVDDKTKKSERDLAKEREKRESKEKDREITFLKNKLLQAEQVQQPEKKEEEPPKKLGRPPKNRE